MKKYWTKEEIDYLKENFEKTPWEELSKHFSDRSEISISKKAYALNLRRESILWTKEDDILFKKLYPIATQKELLKAFPGRTKISIKQRATKVLKVKRKYKNWDLDLFDINTPWSDEKAWVLGLIWSDGYLSTQNRICLSSIDLELIKQFKKILQIKEETKIIPSYHKKINSYVCQTKELYVIGFSSIKMSKDLKRLGCHHKKSYTIDYPKELPDKYFWSFFRGLMDGDGCVCVRKNNSFFVLLVTASKKLKDSLIFKFDELGIKHNMPKLRKNNVYSISVLASSWKTVYNNMYFDNKVPCLHRKQKKFKRGIEYKNRRY